MSAPDWIESAETSARVSREERDRIRDSNLQRVRREVVHAVAEARKVGRTSVGDELAHKSWQVGGPPDVIDQVARELQAAGYGVVWTSGIGVIREVRW